MVFPTQRDYIMCLVFSIIAAIVDGRFLSVSQLNWYSQLPSLDVMRAQLCSTLSSLGSQLTNVLTYHPSELTRCLDEHQKAVNAPSSDSTWCTYFAMKYLLVLPWCAIVIEWVFFSYSSVSKAKNNLLCWAWSFVMLLSPSKNSETGLDMWCSAIQLLAREEKRQLMSILQGGYE